MNSQFYCQLKFKIIYLNWVKKFTDDRLGLIEK